MRNLKSYLLSRNSSLTIISTIVMLVFLSSQIPQHGISSPESFQKWENSHRAFLPAVRLLGLDRIYSSPFFICIVFLALASLAISSVEMARQAYTRTFEGVAPNSTDTFASIAMDSVPAVLARHGYHPLGTDRCRYVKAPWGYWGNFTFHLGLALTVAASLFIALTYQRSTLVLYQGLPLQADQSWQGEEHGLLTQPLQFPYGLRLNRLRREYTSAGVTTRMTSELTLTAPNGQADTIAIPLNGITDRDGVRIYQSINYGDLFVVDFTGPDGTTHSVPLPLYQPNDLTDTSYRDFIFPWLPFDLSAHYDADVNRRSMAGGNMILAMRIADKGQEMGKVYLQTGEENHLGPYRVRLLGIGTWTSLAFVHIIGMPLVFFGFIVTCVGLILQYVTVPREIGVTQVDGDLSVGWRATRFADFYAEEHANILKELKRGHP